MLPSPFNTLQPGMKGYPHGAATMACEDVAAQGWNVLADDLPFPVAVIHRKALQHNLHWMQTQARGWGVDMAPHGKTTMSPQLFQAQLAAGAWGITFANVTQLRVGVAAGLRRALIANQVVGAQDLSALQGLLRQQPALRVVFLLDSLAQLQAVEAFFSAHQTQHPHAVAFEVLLEIGVPAGRTGCRSHDEALALAERAHASAAVRLVGVECYEGLSASGRTEADAQAAQALMARVQAVAAHCDAAGWFGGDEVLLSAGGSAVFDLVAPGLRQQLSRPVRGLLRSGCYVTHDHGHYKRLVNVVEQRLGCAQNSTLQPALEVWALVQSCPEPGLALLNAGRRDLSFDVALPMPVARAAAGSLQPAPVPASWKVTGLNDQHAHLRWDAADAAAAPQVGERVALGIAHPCTTFDKWQWLALVEDDYRVSGAVRTFF